jgi:copper chaperone CopZ
MEPSVMSHYIHHVPGRIRVRTKAFRCRSEKAQAAERQLKAMAGVRQVRVNPHAGSITVHYDTAALEQSDLLTALEQLGCLQAASRSDEVARKMGEMFGKALVGAVVQKAVEQSARTLVGALI